MRLLLLGDIHAHRLLVPPWHLLGKSLFGQLNLLFRRRQKFDLSLLPPTVARAVGLRPDLVLYTGDLTTTAARGEFADVAAALRPLLAAAPSVAIPGNHDRYTLSATLGRYFERTLPGAIPPQFPFHRHVSDLVRRPEAGTSPGGQSRWHVLALDSARPTLFTSRGRVGRRQLAEARLALASLSPADGLLVLCHYTVGKPPEYRPSPWHHLLADAPAVLSLLGGFRGRTLFIHGHVHRPWVWPRTEEGLRHVIDVNAGAPCYVHELFPRGQGFWELDLPPQPHAAITFHHHQLAANGTDWQVETTTIAATA